MKKILASLFCISLLTFTQSVKAQITTADLQGTWTLSAMEGNDTANVLTPEQIQTSSNNYLHDFPLTLTVLTINNATDFSMTHHGTGLMSGTYTLAEPFLTLQVFPDGCATCPPKDFVFIIHSISSTELVLALFDENTGSSTYAKLTLTK